MLQAPAPGATDGAADGAFMTPSMPFDGAVPAGADGDRQDDGGGIPPPGQQVGAQAPGAPPGIQIFEEEDLDRGPCAPSSIQGFVCQKAHVNGTLRIHWTPWTPGGAARSLLPTKRLLLQRKDMITKHQCPQECCVVGYR